LLCVSVAIVFLNSLAVEVFSVAEASNVYCCFTLHVCSCTMSFWC